MQKIILLTAGTEMTPRGMQQIHLYKTYVDAIEAQGALPLLAVSNDAMAMDRAADIADALFLTGGGDVCAERYGQTNEGLSNEPDLWCDELDLGLCERFIARRKPIFGICRGCQVINVAFGGTLHQDIPTSFRLTHSNGTTHDVDAEASSLVGRMFGDKFIVNSYHHQSIDRLGEGLRATARSEGGKIIEAIEHESLPIAGFQWHPERMTGAARRDKDGPDMAPLFEWLCCISH